MLTRALLELRREKVRFLVGGSFNTAFGYALFALLYRLLHPALNYVVILAMSQVLSTVNNFTVYRWFVFRVRGRVLADGLRFSSVYLSAYVANLVALPLLVRAGGLPPLPAQAIVVTVIAVSCYLAHRHFSFRRPMAVVTSPR